MPLSDEELKILKEIEAQLNATDPRLVDTVSRTTVYRHSLGMIRWALFALVGGLVLVVATFATNVTIAFIGFLVMLASLYTIATNMNKIGKAGLYTVFGIREGGLTSLGEQLRDRLQRRPEGDDPDPH